MSEPSRMNNFKRAFIALLDRLSVPDGRNSRLIRFISSLFHLQARLTGLLLVLLWVASLGDNYWFTQPAFELVAVAIAVKLVTFGE